MSIVLAHKRPNHWENDQMIGFIDFSSETVEFVDEITKSVLNSYNYNNSEGNCWLMFNYATQNLKNTNYNNAIVYYSDSNNQYQYAVQNSINYVQSSAGTNMEQKPGICLPVQSNSSLNWNSYEYYIKAYDTTNHKKRYKYHKFKELKLDSGGNIDPNGTYAGKTGFIGDKLTDRSKLGNPGYNDIGYDNTNKTFSPGTLKQFKNTNSTTGNKKVYYITAPEDCWLYSNMCHKGLIFSNKSNPNVNLLSDWVAPFIVRDPGVEIKGGVVTYLKAQADAVTKFSGLLIPLKKGQSFGLAATDDSTTHEFKYELYKMDYSWNSRVTWIDFNNVLYQPTQLIPTFPKSAKPYTFEYTAQCNCWAYIGVQGGDRDESWTIDGKEAIADNYNNATLRFCRFIPLRYGQKLTYTSVKAAQSNWGSDNSQIIRFAVYGMKPLM